MKIGFRQGIVKHQTDINGQSTFLQKSILDSQYVDLVVSPDPTVICFAHKNANYIFEEAKTVAKAWGPFTTSATRYLYWDINVLTAELTRGHTSYPPIVSAASPLNPVIEQHWFDTEETAMKVWNGAKWVEKIRCFAGFYSSSAIIRPYSNGTQVGITEDTDAGNIVLDGFNKPLRQSDGSFLTSTVGMSVVGIATKKIKIEAELLSVLALENTPRFSCIQMRPGRTCILARSGDRMSRVAGIAVDEMYAGETSDVITQGLIRSDVWNWPTASVNRPLFCGPNGELTLTPPGAGVLQQIGSVYDVDAIYVNIFPSITLDHPDGISLPPSPPPAGTPVPVIAAAPNVRVGNAPFLVNFQNATSGAYAPFLLTEWDFTNDGVIDSTLSNPSYTYTTAGTYNVRLRVTNASGAGQTVETGYIVVNQPPPPVGYTNLEVRFIVDGKTDDQNVRVKRSNTFGVKLRVANDGYLTATNVQRTFLVHDVNGQQVTVVTPPPGAAVVRGQGFLKITFALIPSLTSGSSTDYPPFVLKAPNVSGMMKLEASVSSPEADSTISDNTRALTIEIIS